MSRPRCDRCRERPSVRYVVSPFRHVGDYWLCDGCRQHWLAIQAIPSLDRMAPLIEPDVQLAIGHQAERRCLAARTVYQVGRRLVP